MTPTPGSFAYTAQTFDGQPISGAIDAATLDDATRRLRGLNLRVIDIEPRPGGGARKPSGGGAIRGEDFVAFNQQFAQLAGAGLPVEQGLRLVAREMRSRRHARTIRQVTEEMEKGTPLGEAFALHAAKFPPLYGRLIGAGVKAGNLPGVLLNLGRHAEMVQRLRGALWRAASYPMMVVLLLLGVLFFITRWVLPQFRDIYAGFRVELPWLSSFLLGAGDSLGTVLAGLIALVLAAPAFFWLMGRLGHGPALTDRLLLPAPLVGPILRRNLIARWCDALSLGIEAGLDLPAAMDLAGEVVASPRLRRDGLKLTEALRAGRRLDSAGGLSLLPPVVPAAMQLASDVQGLPAAVAALSQMYQQQAELRLSVLPAVLTPILMLFTAALIALVVAAALLPLLTMFKSLTGG